MFRQCGKDVVKMGFVFFQGFRENDNVVKVDNATTPGVTKGTQGLMHGSLENCWGVDKTHRHYHKFVESFRAAESGLEAVFFCNGNLVEPGNKIQS